MDFINKGTKQDVLYWSKRLYQKGMAPATSGNISTKTNDGILISAKGTCLNDMDENDIILIDCEGNIKKGKKKPSSEKIMHCEIYKRRSDISAIIHSHCPVIGAFAVSGVEISKPILPDFCYMFDKIPVVPYFCPSSIELAQAVGEYFEEYDAILMQNHGIVVGSDNLQSAFYILESIRTYCETYFGAEVLGGAKNISKQGIKEIKQLRN